MIYEYQCKQCKRTTEAVRKLADRENGPECEHCEIQMEQVILTAPYSVPPVWNISYKCQATGQVITSMRQRQRIMDENGLMDARELGEPDWDSMAQESINVKESAAKPIDVPPDLKDAMIREGHGDLLL